jgi:hypothetical protein
MFKSFGNIFKTALIAAPILLTKKSYDCGLWSSKKKPNSIEDRLYYVQLVSNKPCEDRYDFRQLKNLNAYVAAVYDGHGGWQVVHIYPIKIYLVIIMQKSPS